MQEKHVTDELNAYEFALFKLTSINNSFHSDEEG